MAENDRLQIAQRSRARRPAEEHGRTVLFPSDVLDALEPHAAIRGCTANSLARRIVAAVLDDDLITAVLDDADELANG